MSFRSSFIAAACAEGTTVLTGAEELRVKESDRIQVMADGLTNLGVKVQPTPDGIIIEGGPIGGGRVVSHGDHRISMSFTVAALRATGLSRSKIALMWPPASRISLGWLVAPASIFLSSKKISLLAPGQTSMYRLAGLGCFSPRISIESTRV
jgi:hypothetical protein